MRIIYVMADKWACGLYRMTLPGMEMRKRGHDVAFSFTYLHEIFDQPWDILVLQRQVTKNAYKLGNKLRDKGTKVVYEMDDSVWDIPLYNGYWAQGRKNAPITNKILEFCDAAITTTEPLAIKMRRFNPNTYVIPNSLPAQAFDGEGSDLAHHKSLFWAGSHTHRADLREIADVIKYYLYKGHYCQLFGCTSKSIGEHYNLITHPACEIEEYMQLLHARAAGIALAPLKFNEFNSCKSGIKWLEYTSAGMPVIATDILPYSSVITDFETGFLVPFNKHEVWQGYINLLFADSDLYKRIVQQAREEALSKYTIEKIGDLWEQTYESILASSSI